MYTIIAMFKSYLRHMTVVSNCNTSLFQVMENMIAKVMAECDKLNASSVAFPALGTGALRFPPNVAAKIMVQAAHQYLQGNPNTSLKKVVFVTYQDEIFNAFQRELSGLELAPALSSGLTRAQPLPPVQPKQASSSQHVVSQKSMEPMPIRVAKGPLTQAQVRVNCTWEIIIN